jgi:hypothetical protein
MRNDIIDRINWRVHREAADAALANGHCFECASEFGFRASEAMVKTERDRGNMCSRSKRHGRQSCTQMLYIKPEMHG